MEGKKERKKDRRERENYMDYWVCKCWFILYRKLGIEIG
jgi:hypothetical protein